MELLEVRKWKWSNQLYDVDGDDDDDDDDDAVMMMTEIFHDDYHQNR